MSRKNIKCSELTYDVLRAAKQDGESWDDCLQRLALLDRAKEVREMDADDLTPLDELD